MFYQNFIQKLIHYKFSILLLILLILIALQPIDFALSKPITLGAISVFLMFCVLTFNRFYIIFIFLFTTLISFDAYFAYAFSSHINIGFMSSIMETNFSEAKSMLSQAWLPALLIFILLFILFYQSAQELKSGTLTFRYFIIAYLTSLLLIAAVYKTGYDREALHRFRNEYPMLIYNNLAYTYTPMVYGDIFSIFASYDDQKRFKNFKSSTNKPLAKGIKWNNDQHAPQKIFLVIGESAYRGHHSLYGYDQPTTPFLDSLLHANKQTLSFYNGIAGANITRNAMRLIMSSATAHQLEFFYKEKNLIDMAKDAGYKTTWISNQGNTSLDETYIGYLAASADTTLFLTKTYFQSNDLNILPTVEEELKTDDKQLIVIHLVGSHQNYKDRFDLEDTKKINTQNEILKDYDCSIHHTDRFMRKLSKIVQSQESYLIYYTSDHGEEPGKGHGFRGNRYQFDVPLLTISSSKPSTDSIFSKYIHPTTGTLSNVNTLYFIGEVMGYTVEDSIRNKQMKESMYILYADQSIEHYDDIAPVE